MTSPKLNDIVFTQYLRPDGRRSTIWIERPDEIVRRARKIVALGYHFDAEVLISGQVSFTVEPDRPDETGEDTPIAHEICGNGPVVLDAVDRLILNAARKLGV